MRLTLRTLLAYRDSVLPPQVHEDLHRRIQQNAPIANLLRQINDLVISSDLPSPKLDASGLSDANVIAEYLDDTLTSERVAELERLCLQQADHLCELAHCHQLLAQAMLTHVSVTESLRLKAVGLGDPQQRELVREQLLTRSGNRPNPSTTSSAGSSDSLQDQGSHSRPSEQNVLQLANPDVQVNVEAPMVASGGGTIRQGGLDLESTPLASEVPAYLLASQRRRWKIPAAIIGLSIILGLLVWQSVGSLDWQSMWAESSTSGAQTDASKPAEKSDPQDPASVKNDLREAEPQVAENANESLVDASDAPDIGSSNGKPSEATNATPTTVADISSDTAPLDGKSESVIPDPTLATTDGTTAIPPPDVSLSDAEIDSQDGQDEVSLDQPPLSFGLAWNPLDSSESKAVVLVQPDDSPLQMLSQLEQPMPSGRVIVPSSVRTTLQMVPWQWLTGGPCITDIQVAEQSIELSPRLFRGMLMSTDPRIPLVLTTPAGNYSLQVVDRSVWLAVEFAYRPVVRGSLDEEGTFSPVLIIVAGSDNPELSGDLARVLSQDETQEIIIRQSGQGVAAVGGQALAEFNLQTPPRWYGKRSIRLIDQEASQDYFAALQTRQVSLTDQISQLVRHDRPELAAQAIQTQLLLGNWRPVISDLLMADRFRAHWTATIDLARQLAVGDPTRLTGLHELMEEDFGSEADRLHELFVGLRRDKQTNDGLAALVKGLESDSLPTRILSSYELSQLTGSDHGYLPHAPVRATIQQIRRQQNTGRLSITPIPDPIWERSPQP